MELVQNKPAKLLLTVQSIILEMVLSTRTLRYAPEQPNYREEHLSAARSALILYFCENENILEAEKGGM